MSAAWPRLCAAILLAASALAQQPPPTEEATGSVEGTVLDAVTGEPIRKAEVDLNGTPTQGGTQVNLRAGTDASGHFAFRALPGGTYGLYAQHPGYGYGTPSAARARIALQPGEQKSGIEIRLSPQGTISGKVVDEFDAPVANCSVSALQRQTQGGRHSLVSRSGVATNDRGEYWIQGLEKGRYYVAVRCNGELEAPHALMPARDPRRPTLVYAPQFYPGVPDVNGATRLGVTPGTETQGVDFQVHRVSGVTVRVRVDAPDLSVLQNANLQAMLLPPSLDPFETEGFGASLDRRTGEFQIRSVTPGSYVVIVYTIGTGPVYQARLPIQIGATPPDPIHVTLAPASEMSGTLEVEGDNAPPLEGLAVILEPLSNLPFPRPPQARVSKDGTFSVTGLTPGRWRLILAGGPYVKSFSIGDRDASPYGFDLAPGTAGPIHILACTKTGQVQAAVSATSAGEAINFLLVPADPERLDGGLVRSFPAGNGQATLTGVVPGRYRLFAFDAPQRWDLQQLPEVLAALEGHAQLVEVGEGQTVQVTAEPIEAGQLKDALEENQ